MNRKSMLDAVMVPRSGWAVDKGITKGKISIDMAAGWDQ